MFGLPGAELPLVQLPPVLGAASADVPLLGVVDEGLEVVSTRFGFGFVFAR